MECHKGFVSAAQARANQLLVSGRVFLREIRVDEMLFQFLELLGLISVVYESGFHALDMSPDKVGIFFTTVFLV